MLSMHDLWSLNPIASKTQDILSWMIVEMIAFKSVIPRQLLHNVTSTFFTFSNLKPCYKIKAKFFRHVVEETFAQNKNNLQHLCRLIVGCCSFAITSGSTFSNDFI